MNNISFTSLINCKSFFDFNNFVAPMQNNSFVKSPWTLKESVLAQDVFTRRVLDCTVCVISDGEKALMLHINPNCDDAKEFYKIENYITDKIDLSNPDLQGFLLGGNNKSSSMDRSYDLFEKFEKFLDKVNIPYTALKGTKGETAVAYSSTKDEFVITSTARVSPCDFNTPLERLKNMFEYVRIAKHDTLNN